ncbi:MAG: aldehyde dehydrogenase family protein, partial [Actinomycetota bacterium]|nr:aldehyde dehydrogenase family protein [Actinomycetota bacterium]
MPVAAPPEALSDTVRAWLGDGRHSLLIGEERRAAADGRTFETLDPATGKAIAEVPQAGAADVDAAVRAARAAFDEGPWRTMTPAVRARVLQRFAAAVADHADELAELESLDNGKPLKLARKVDLAETIDYL